VAVEMKLLTIIRDPSCLNLAQGYQDLTCSSWNAMVFFV